MRCRTQLTPQPFSERETVGGRLAARHRLLQTGGFGISTDWRDITEHSLRISLRSVRNATAMLNLIQYRFLSPITYNSEFWRSSFNFHVSAPCQRY